MSVIAVALKHMLAAGVPHEAIVAAVAEMEANLQKDPVAERRRAKDRERKRAVPRNSTESTETASVPPTSTEFRRVRYRFSLNKNSPHTPLKTKTLSKEKPPKGVKKKASLLPVDWQPSKPDRERGHKLGLSERQIDQTADKMRDWAAANAHRPIAKKSDWSATFRNFLVREAENRPRDRGGGRPRAAEGFL